MDLEFKMGHPVKDRLTGFKGLVTGFCTYITGCDQYLVQPTGKEDGTVADAKWLDVARLEVDPDGSIVELFDKPKAVDMSMSDRRTMGAGEPAPIK